MPPHDQDADRQHGAETEREPPAPGGVDDRRVEQRDREQRAGRRAFPCRGSPPCTLALHAVLDTGRVVAGQRVLGVGVRSTGKVDLVRSLGADQVVDDSREDFAADAVRYDLVIDIGGNSPVSRLRSVLTPTGTLVMVGGESGGRWTGGFGRQLRAVVRSPFVGQRLTMQVPSEHFAGLERLAELIDAGSVTPSIERTCELDGVPDAITRVGAGRVRGKLVVTVGQRAE